MTPCILRVGLQFVQTPGVAFTNYSREAFRYAGTAAALSAALKLARMNQGVPVDVFNADTLARVGSFLIQRDDAPPAPTSPDKNREFDGVPREIRARAANSRWQPADKQRADACEAAFQSGGPRVYVYDVGDAWTKRPSPHSALRALELADAGQIVCARRKDGKQYSWFCAVAK